MKLTTIADIYWWCFWLLVAFGCPETWALVSGHPEATFSDTVWRGLDVLPGQTLVQWNLLRALACAAWLLVGVHLFTGWPK